MKIKIIASRPKGEHCSDIEEFVGQEFSGDFLGDDVIVRHPLGYEMIVFAGEYEIVEVWKEYEYGICKVHIKNKSVL